jgi:glucokinase
MSGWALLADVGGTNARFALARGGRIGTPVTLATDDFADLPQALAHALHTLGARSLHAAAMCAAGPPRDGTIALTNHPWQASEAALRAATGVERPLLVNDFTALAAALPALGSQHLRALGGGAPEPGAARAVIGPGTGLGVSGLLPGTHGEAIISGEGGHADLAAASAEEDRILLRLRARFGHVSAERVLSGGGLEALFAAMQPHLATGTPLQAQAIAARAADGDAAALACVRQFCAWLGAVAGDLALTLGARGGVYVGGGIVPAWGTLFQDAVFRQRFEDKGRYREYLRAIPTYIITTPQPALIGLQRLLAQQRRT